MNFFKFFTSKSTTQSTQPSKQPSKQATKQATEGEDNLKIINSLRDQVELLEKRKEVIKRKQEDITENAKLKSKNGDKKGAILLLNQRKKNEIEIDKIAGTQLLLENQLFTLESATMNKETFNALRIGNNAIKEINKGITPDLIDEIMDEMQETQDTSQQIQNMINAPLQNIYDDAELLNELNELEGLNELDESAATLIDLPSVPKTNPIVKQKEDQDEDDEIMTELRNIEKGMLISS